MIRGLLLDQESWCRSMEGVTSLNLAAWAGSSQDEMSSWTMVKGLRVT